MDNETHRHRLNLFESARDLNNLLVEIQEKNVVFVNSTLCPQTDLRISDNNSSIMNCQFKESSIQIGANSHLNDLTLTNKRIEIPANLAIQNVHVDFRCLNGETELSLNIVLGVDDHLTRLFDPNSSDWKVMNVAWAEFSRTTSISESDLWSAADEERCLMNAKLYPVLNINMDREEMLEIREFFWTDLINSENKPQLVSKWRNSMRLSIQDILATCRLDRLFEKRRFISNSVNAELLVKEVVAGRSIDFVSLIRKAVSDGYAGLILGGFDQAASENCDNLVLVPRLLSFISITLSEMAQEFGTLRSGPALNLRWMDSFELIETQKVGGETKYALFMTIY